MRKAMGRARLLWETKGQQGLSGQAQSLLPFVSAGAEIKKERKVPSLQNKTAVAQEIKRKRYGKQISAAAGTQVRHLILTVEF